VQCPNLGRALSLSVRRCGAGQRVFQQTNGPCSNARSNSATPATSVTLPNPTAKEVVTRPPGRNHPTAAAGVHLVPLVAEDRIGSACSRFGDALPCTGLFFVGPFLLLDFSPARRRRSFAGALGRAPQLPSTSGGSAGAGPTRCPSAMMVNENGRETPRTIKTVFPLLFFFSLGEPAAARGESRRVASKPVGRGGHPGWPCHPASHRRRLSPCFNPVPQGSVGPIGFAPPQHGPDLCCVCEIRPALPATGAGAFHLRQPFLAKSPRPLGRAFFRSAARLGHSFRVGF